MFAGHFVNGISKNVNNGIVYKQKLFILKHKQPFLQALNHMTVMFFAFPERFFHRFAFRNVNHKAADSKQFIVFNHSIAVNYRRESCTITSQSGVFCTSFLTLFLNRFSYVFHHSLPVFRNNNS